MLDSVIGSLIAAVIVKFTGKMHESLSKLQVYSQKLDSETEQKIGIYIKEIESKIDSYSKKLKFSCALTEKILTICHIKGTFERAYGILLEQATSDQLGAVRILFRDTRIDAAMNQLKIELDKPNNAKKISELLKTIKTKTSDVLTCYIVLSGNITPDLIRDCLIRLKDLEEELIKLAEEMSKYE